MLRAKQGEVGRGGTSAREISFVSFMAYGPNSDSALTMGVTASETRQGGSQHLLLYVMSNCSRTICCDYVYFFLLHLLLHQRSMYGLAVLFH